MLSTLGHAAYTWREIWETKTVLEDGCCWRVSDGKSINIWEDYWIPGHRKILSRELGLQGQDIAEIVENP